MQKACNFSTHNEKYTTAVLLCQVGYKSVERERKEQVIAVPLHAGSLAHSLCSLALLYMQSALPDIGPMDEKSGFLLLSNERKRQPVSGYTYVYIWRLCHTTGCLSLTQSQTCLNCSSAFSPPLLAFLCFTTGGLLYSMQMFSPCYFMVIFQVVSQEKGWRVHTWEHLL